MDGASPFGSEISVVPIVGQYEVLSFNQTFQSQLPPEWCTTPSFCDDRSLRSHICSVEFTSVAIAERLAKIAPDNNYSIQRLGTRLRVSTHQRTRPETLLALARLMRESAEL